ncbi:MAG TPA: thioesterase family protein [Novosphingobium sp.]|nr:thioesterase family protein [Novosphingobium sp.]
MPFTTTWQVRFADVDPAGIVFYPRYLEMLNGAVEDWFATDLGVSFRQMHMVERFGVPTVKLDVTFLSPSELGDVLTIGITPSQVGRSSCTFTALFSAEGRDRLRAEVVLVCMDLDEHVSCAWPESVRERMLAAMAET